MVRLAPEMSWHSIKYADDTAFFTAKIFNIKVDAAVEYNEQLGLEVSCKKAEIKIIFKKKKILQWNNKCEKILTGKLFQLSCYFVAVKTVDEGYPFIRRN